MGASFKTFRIGSPNGLTAEFTNFGARIMSLFVPVAGDNTLNVCLGFRTPEEFFLADEQYFGAIVGRYCNRISKGRFELDGIVYELAKNIDDNHLHGGIEGFHKQLWGGRKIAENAVEFSHLSKDGEEGYPGNLRVLVMYSIVGMELHITMRAETDRKTHVNLTSHPYFNLKGEGNGSVMDHELIINADHFTPVNESVIPTGEIRTVKGSPFDFSTGKRIGEHIDQEDHQLHLGNGYDHNFVLNKSAEAKLESAAIVHEPVSGLTMELLTTEPGLQFYSANWLSGKDVGYSGKSYRAREAFCLEPQHFPDSPNQYNFPRTFLMPGEVFKTRTVLRFSQS
jgi:aldose 1-epimerase